jgi:hypothetical protein
MDLFHDPEGCPFEALWWVVWRSPVVAALMTGGLRVESWWWFMSRPLFAAVVVVLVCALWGWKMLRSGWVFFETCSHGVRRFGERRSAGKCLSSLAAATGVASVQSDAAFRRYIGGVGKKLSCSRFENTQTR